MRNVIIGTAGHVDHGKTTLIKALTGIDTDRLKEEKERGMTIDIGFASLTFPNGQTAGIVDVPGHERFIKNMLAGAGGVDVALLVVAADESVMPQTVEHLEILELLQVRHGVVALTKADTVDTEWLQYAKDDVRAALAETFLSDAPIIPVSAVTGQGLPELLSALMEACERVEDRDVTAPFRIPIDRVFTMTGFGTVVTGSLVSGTIRVGDPVEIMPAGIASRVRQLHAYGQKSEVATVGMRVAVNLVGVEVNDVSRGDVCAQPGTLRASNLLDLRLTLLKTAEKPLMNAARVRLHVGTTELLGRIVLLDRDELVPGEQAYAQFRSETLAAAGRGDRFVIRSYSPMATVGGGVVIDPVAKRHRRFDPQVISSLESRSGSVEDMVEQVLRQSTTGATKAELSKAAGIADIGETLESLKARGRCFELDDGRLLHASVMDELSRQIVASLTQFHAKNPLKVGMPKEELRSTVGKGFDSRSFAAVLALLERASLVAMSENLVHLPDRQVTLGEAEQAAADRIDSQLKRTGFNVPSTDELLAMAGIPAAAARDLLELLVSQGKVVRITSDLVFHADTVRRAEEILRDYLEKNGTITVSEFRDLTGSSRKYALPLLEYFDSKRVTRRMGDQRILAGGTGQRR